MTKSELNEKQLTELAEILELAKVAEHKAREMSEFATAIDEKWQKRLEGRRVETSQAGDVL